MKSILKLEISTTSLIVTNLFLMTMAIIYKWTIYDQIMVFWCENLVIGFYTLIKLPMCRDVLPENREHFPVKPKHIKFIISPFFLIVFLMFCAMHLAMIHMLFYDDVESYANAHEQNYFPQVNWNVVLISIAALFVNHGISFIINFLGKKEYLTYRMDQMLILPYKRVMLVHLIVMVFGLLLNSAGRASIIGIVLFFLAKIWIDIRRHRAEHSVVIESTYGWF